mgnify:CR=1 FL=1
MYLHANENSNQLCVSDASCIASVILFLKTALYRLFLHDSARLEHTDLEERRIWLIREYVSSFGNPFEISYIFIAAIKAFLYTSRSLKCFIVNNIPLLLFSPSALLIFCLYWLVSRSLSISILAE